MPIIKSAIKRVRQEKRRRDRNAITKRRYKELMKQYMKLIENGQKKEAAELYPTVQKAIDMAAKKNLLHDNNAGHKKSRLAKMLNQENTPQPEATPKKSTTKKTTAKKTTKKATTPKKTEDKK